jgi:uncharacterized phage protein gp47/JayE
MTYSPPTFSTSGLAVPTYADIVAYLVNAAKGLWGQDAYLEADSQDYQLISAFASILNDVNQGIQAAYNSRGPSTASGAALDALVKLNGIVRLAATPSTCVVTLTGTPGTIITNGVMQDASGYQWALPGPVSIGIGGTVSVTATCQATGPVTAAAGTITGIVTPTYGWTSVTNASAATVGSATETDSALRARQALSTAMPSRTVLEGTEAAIAAVTGVTRFAVFENDTAATVGSLPAHSISCIVEGGSDSDVATAIWAHKGPGCLTSGTTSVNLTDAFGQVTPIGFYRPSYVDFDVVVNVKGLAGYTTGTTAAIQAAIAAYLSGLALATPSVYISSLWGAALSVQSLSSPLFSVTSLTAAKHGDSQDTADIALAFNELARGDAANVSVVVS